MKIVFMGTPIFAVAPLTKLANSKHEIVAVFAQPDKPQGRKREIVKTPVHQVCTELQLPYFAPTKLKDGVVAQQIKDLECDILVTAAYGRILPKAILDAPKIACINIHGSLLPKYRGASPIQTALIDGVRETGVTILRMVEEMDAGNILATATYTITDEDDTSSLMLKLSELGTELLLPLLDELEKGIQSEIIQDDNDASYTKMLTRESGVVAWQSMTSNEIFHLYQGTKPWPGLYTYLNGKRFKLLTIKKIIPEQFENILTSYWSKVTEESKESIGSGYLFSPDGKTLLVTTKDGYLEIIEFQKEGQKATLAKEAAHNFQKGIFFSEKIF